VISSTYIRNRLVYNTSIIMNLSENLINSVLEEIEMKVDEHMSKYIQYISKKYHIPQNMLIADKLNVINSTYIDKIDTKQCNGITQKKTRCKAYAKKQGYCKRHVDQYIPMQKAVSTEDMNLVKHTHPFTTLYQKGCPECEKNNTTSENTLIGL